MIAVLVNRDVFSSNVNAINFSSIFAGKIKKNADRRFVTVRWDVHARDLN